MTKNYTKINSKSESMVQLLNENEAVALFGAAYASAALANPTVVWAKFTLTDDRVNGNNQRVPKEEFSNLISSGVNMPIKMAIGEISPGHEPVKPIGVMTAFKQVITEMGTNAIIALAALWEKERPADVKYIKERVASGQSVDISWELLYSDAVFNSEQGSIDLLGTVLTAAAIVSEPAYGGRTQFLSVAAKKWSKAYAETLPNTHFAYVGTDGVRYFPIADAEGKLDRAKIAEAVEGIKTLGLPESVAFDKDVELQSLLLEFNAGASIDDVSNNYLNRSIENTEEPKLNELQELKDKLSEAEGKLNAALAELEEKKNALQTAEAELSTLKEKVTSDETELTTLREFKASLDAEVEKQEKIQAIREKFAAANIQKPDEYFVENSEKLLKLDEETLTFMLAEMKPAEVTEGQASTIIPNLQNSDTEDVSVETLGKYLRERKSKKK